MLAIILILTIISTTNIITIITTIMTTTNVITIITTMFMLQAPRFLLKMESFPKILAGQGVRRQKLIIVVNGRQTEWCLWKQ